MDYLNINVNSYDYKLLSNEDKLKVVRAKLNDLIENKKGKTATVYYKKKRVDIPYAKMNMFKDLCKKEKSLEKKVNVDFVCDFETEKRNEYSNQFYCDLAAEQPEDEKPLIEEQEEDLCSVWNGAFNKRKSTLNKQPCGVLNINNIFRTIDNANVQSVAPAVKINSRKEKTKNNSRSMKGILTGLIAIPFIKKAYDKIKRVKNIIKDRNDMKVYSKNKSRSKKGFLTGLIAIPFIKKAYDKINGKKRIKNIFKERNDRKRNIKVAAIAFGLVATTMIGSFVPGMFKKKSSSSKGNAKSTSYVEEVPTVCEPTVNDDVIDSYVEDEIIESQDITDTDDAVTESLNDNESGTDETKVSDNYSISFDDKVTINDNSYIYTNSYDATDENNCLIPLYDGSYERDIMGVVYSLDGYIYTIYSNDLNAYDKASELIAMGAKEEAVLVTRSDLSNSGEYEGYYNINDINVLKRVR